MAEPLLTVNGITCRFGGLLAVNAASLTAQAGQITALIGPNGAGKTTLFSIISGFVRANQGSVHFAGQDVTGEPPHRLARRGIARTFQIVQPFFGLSVRENVLVGAHLHHRKRDAALAAADQIGRDVGLGEMLDKPADALTVAGRKRLELARALATEPKLLLLDEVLAGLNPSEIRDIVPVIRDFCRRGITILMIEHVMQAVMSLAEHVFVLAEGRIIAKARPQKLLPSLSSLRPTSVAVRQQSWERSMDVDPLLAVGDLHAGYGETEVLHGVDLMVSAGEIVAVLGSNGVGKSTLNRTISGVLRATKGSIQFAGHAIEREKPAGIVSRGLIHVPEGRCVFPNLSVRDNLELGGYRRARNRRQQNREKVFGIFPRLAERQSQRAGSLSGGEQQMLAIGRGLMAEPILLILDEPSLGLSPLLVEELFALIRRINEEGIALLLVEQNVVQSLEVAHRAYILENGNVVLNGASDQLRNDPNLKRAYLGL